MRFRLEATRLGVPGTDSSFSRFVQASTARARTAETTTSSSSVSMSTSTRYVVAPIPFVGGIRL